MLLNSSNEIQDYVKVSCNICTSKGNFRPRKKNRKSFISWCCGVGELWCEGVAVWESCSVGELLCEGVAV